MAYNKVCKYTSLYTAVTDDVWSVTEILVF